jgi:hypothetical protein
MADPADSCVSYQVNRTWQCFCCKTSPMMLLQSTLAGENGCWIAYCGQNCEIVGAWKTPDYICFQFILRQLGTYSHREWFNVCHS